ncbi:unnamed protein product [Peniophora sp. CBMAI 1063]|nr:unnamed protein product [Peniophora sp. CBMAI 1063]
MSLFQHEALATSPSWQGLRSVKHLVIFGDSYSSVDYDGLQSPHPTWQEPLGVPFPGRTWASMNKDDPNWVGHLVNMIADERQDLLVFDYAKGGDRVENFDYQVNKGFQTIRDKPEWAPWTAGDSLFVTWVGINDCAYIGAGIGTAKTSIATLFKYQEILYEAGARNFMFVDVPPMHLAPSWKRLMSPEAIATSTVAIWNKQLVSRAKKFAADHPDATVILFSSWLAFSIILDNPTEYGLKPSDIHEGFSSVWCDHLHPTSSVHRGVALAIHDFLSHVAPVVSPTTTTT